MGTEHGGQGNELQTFSSDNQEIDILQRLNLQENEIIGLKVKEARFRWITITSFAMLAIAIAVIVILVYRINDVTREQEKQQKYNYQLFYHIQQTALQKDRENDAATWITRLALEYNPDFDQKVIAEVAEEIYRIGERQYGIMCEEWGILITLESGWQPDAKSHAGALGLMQLMPATAYAWAREVGIPYEGKSTCLDPVKNVRIGMAYYSFLNKRYTNKIAALTIYNHCETRMIPWLKNYTIPKEKLTYYNLFIKTKEKVERRMGRKIILPGIDDKIMKEYDFSQSTIQKEEGVTAPIPVAQPDKDEPEKEKKEETKRPGRNERTTPPTPRPAQNTIE